MKLFSTLFLLLSLLLSFSLTVHATTNTEPTPSVGPGTLDSVFPMSEETMSLPDFAERLSTPQQGAPATSSYTCRAWTTCPGGYRISCWSRGYRCYSEVTPGYRVYCSASTRSGYTEYWVDYCY